MSTATTTPVGIDGLSPNAVRVLQAIRSYGGRPVGRGEVMQVLGLTVKQWELAKDALVARELVQPLGVNAERRYVATMGDTAGAATFGEGRAITPPRPTAPVPAIGPKARRILRARILDHLSRRTLDTTTLAAHLNATVADVDALLTQLLADSLVAKTSGGWRA